MAEVRLRRAWRELARVWLDELVGSVSVTPDGITHSDPGLPDRLTEVTATVATLPEGLAYQTVAQLAWEAFSHCVKQKTADIDSWEQALARASDRYLKTKPTTFRTATTISVKQGVLPRTATFLGSKIELPSRLPPDIQKERAAYQPRLRKILGDVVDTGYAPILITVQQRSFFDAAERTRKALDAWRGLWTLAFRDRTRTYHWGATSQNKLAMLTLGPMQTVHGGVNSNPSETFWFETLYRFPRSLLPPRQVEANKRLFSYLSRCLHRSAYRHSIEAWLAQYARALDELDPARAFELLYAILEQLTTGNSNSESLIKRGSVLFHNHKSYERRLTLVRHRRNELIHERRNSYVHQELLQDLLEVIHAALKFHILNHKLFGAADEAYDFLDAATKVHRLLNKEPLRNALLKHTSEIGKS